MLRLVPETLLVSMRFHALAALVFGNFRFASFFERAHSDFQIDEPGFNHLMRYLATHFFAAGRRCFRPDAKLDPGVSGHLTFETSKQRDT